jgi:dTDP-4-dehydrorhamnose 3,5-epimerase
MFEKHATELDGVYVLRPRVFRDRRGVFVKTFQRSAFSALGLEADLAEVFYSVSEAGVVRGMHVQRPPHDHAKMVYCAAGRALDVVLDLRAGPGYGRFVSVELAADTGTMVYVPRGCAHGFCVLEAPALVVYHVTSEHCPEADTGIRWDSFGFTWPAPGPLVSARDASLPRFQDFRSPFGI